MSHASKIQSFIKKKLERDNLTRKVFAKESGIPYATVNKLINATRANPELKNIMKIADYYNCAIEKILEGKNNLPKNININKLSLQEISNNLRNFINNKLKEDNLNPYKLSRELGFSENPIIEFINNSNKTLSTEVIVELSNRFKTPIDVMIGRVSLSIQEPQTLGKTE